MQAPVDIHAIRNAVRTVLDRRMTNSIDAVEDNPA
jgi:hypothetical protein